MVVTAVLETLPGSIEQLGRTKMGVIGSIQDWELAGWEGPEERRKVIWESSWKAAFSEWLQGIGQERKEVKLEVNRVE